MEELEVASGDSAELLVLEGSEQHTRISFRAMLAMTGGLGGMQVVWATIFSNGNLYLEALDLRPTTINMVLSLPALCSCVLQPVVGAYSDSCTHPWGRRRPFIIVGALGVMASILTLAWAGSIGHFASMLVLSNPAQDVMAMTTTFVAICSFALLSFALQPLQCAYRALSLDSCHPVQQVEVQVWNVRIMNVGQLVGCTVGVVSMPLGTSMDQISAFRILSLTSALAIIATMIVTVLTVQDTPLAPTHRRLALSPIYHAKCLVRTSCDMSTSTREVLGTQCLAWLGWYAFLFYNTSYIHGIYKGSMVKEDGDNLNGYLGSLSSLLFSTAALTTSLYLPKAISFVALWCDPGSLRQATSTLDAPPLWRIWATSLALSSVLMFSTFLSTGLPATMLLMALNGTSWAVSSSIPFILVGQQIAYNSFETLQGQAAPSRVSRCAASTTGIHNVAISGPQVVAACICQVVLWQIDEPGSFQTAKWLLRAGGCAYLMAAILAVCCMSRRNIGCIQRGRDVTRESSDA